jgi:hypothetical protein
MIDFVAIMAPFIKVMVMVMQGVYVLFAFMLTQQLQIMNKNFKTSLRQFFTLIALGNLIAALCILILTFLTR